jgi:xylan 1,4-beta-xylosidase
MRRNWITIIACCRLAVSTLSGHAQTVPQNSVAPLRYVNPLNVEDSSGLGDPTVLKFKGSYYLYTSGGMVWSSDDLVHWKHHDAVTTPATRVVAPHAFEYNGSVYLTGNDLGLFRAESPLGPWTYVADFTDTDGKKVAPFDPMVMVDNDKRVFLYYSGRSTHGIYGVELNQKDLTKFAGPVKRLMTFDKSHKWERYGTYNEYSEVTWIEGPWMTRHNGIYYLQYSAVGTDWPTYAVGVYTSKSPLGPFTYYPGSPILRHGQGLIRGVGHHCMVEGPDGQLWAFYTVVYRAWNRMASAERRIGMDRVGFDKNGNMFVKGPTEIPQLAPGAKAATENESIPLSVDTAYKVSSEAPGRNAPYAFDDYTATWWSPAENDKQPWLLLDLGAATDQDPLQEFMVDSSRILFSLVSDHPRDRGAAFKPIDGVYKYKIETSLDGKTFETVVDHTGNAHLDTAPFDDFKPVQSRFVKLTMTDWPKNVPLSVLEFTVFGKPVEDSTPRKRVAEEAARRAIATASTDR